MSRKQSRVPGLAARKPRHFWEGIIVSDSHCENPDCTHDLHEHNPWQAFAYTIGMHDVLGLPELRLSATPRTCSVLPVMEVYALGRVLNAVTAHYVQNGGAPVSMTIHRWPGGYEIRASVPDPILAVVSQHDVDCFQAHDDALVLPIEWCAHPDRGMPAA